MNVSSLDGPIIVKTTASALRSMSTRAPMSAARS
jgi:hypothetical protein